MWKTIKYRIESAWITQTPGASRQVHFLDAVQIDDNGRTSTSNICSGDLSYCERKMAEYTSGAKEW